MPWPCTIGLASSAPIRTPAIPPPELFSCGWCWRLETLVDFHLVAAGQAIGLIGHPHHGHQLGEHSVAHSGLARAGGVRGDAIPALISRAYREVNHLLGDGVERARRHDLLDALPRPA